MEKATLFSLELCAMKMFFFVSSLCFCFQSAAQLDGTFVSKFDRLGQTWIGGAAIKNTHKEAGWRGERVYFQVFVWSESDLPLSFSLSDFKGQDVISVENAQIRFPGYVKGDQEARDCGGYQSRSAPYFIGDVLIDEAPVLVKKHDTVAIWVSLDVPSGSSPGNYSGALTVSTESKSLVFWMNLEVLPMTLPSRANWSFHLDLWQFPTAGLQHYNTAHPNAHVDVWSDAHFDFIRPAYEILADAGQKVISAHIKQNALGSPSMIKWSKDENQVWSYDFTVFDRYVDEMMTLGINKQISCFSPVGWNESVIPYWNESSQAWEEIEVPIGSDEYSMRWDHFLTAFKDHLDDKGWFDISVLYFDEVSESKLNSVVKMVQANDPSWKLGIAYSHGLSGETKSNFYDLSGIIGVASNSGVAEDGTSTFYTSCTQTFPNNYVTPENSLAEMTWMGYYSSQRKFDGYLRWAFDYWKNSDPLDIRDQSNTAGDFSFIYRNGNDLPVRYYSSIRLEMLREGIEDFEKIRKLKEVYGQSDDPQEIKLIEALDQLLIEFTLHSSKRAKEVVMEAQRELKRLPKWNQNR